MTAITITGGHSGIGLAVAQVLAAQHIDLVLAGRSVERMRPVADELSAQHGVSVTTLTLDTSPLASVRTAATRFRTMLDSGEVSGLDAIVCNAGGRFDGDISYSPDGTSAFQWRHRGVHRRADAGHVRSRLRGPGLPLRGAADPAGPERHGTRCRLRGRTLMTGGGSLLLRVGIDVDLVESLVQEGWAVRVPV